MLLHCIVILAIYVSLSAFIRCLFNVLCCTRGCVSLVPHSTSCCSFLRVVTTKKQNFLGRQGCYLSGPNIPSIKYTVVFNNEGVLVACYANPWAAISAKSELSRRRAEPGCQYVTVQSNAHCKTIKST